MAKKTTAKSDFSKLGHVGVVVKDINKAIEYLEKLGIGPFSAPDGKKTFSIDFKGELHGKPAKWTTTISFAKMGGTELELLEPTKGNQALKESLDKTGEGLHHMGLEVDNLEEFIQDVEGKGFKIPVRDEFSNRSEVVLRPRDAAGVVLQILQWKGGSSETIEDRIERIRNLQNRPKE